MKLERSQLEKIIHNVISYDYDENGGLHFRRFTESQRLAYAEESAEWIVRANASASVTLDFISNSDYLAMKFDLYAGSSQGFAGFDLFVDGIFYQHKSFDNRNAKLVSFSLPVGEHRITLYFPWTTETVVNEVHLSDGASLLCIPNRRKAIFLGDSITQGYVATYPSLTYVNQVARETDTEIVNQGIGGYYFGVNSIDESLALYAPDFIVVAYGTNDYSKYESRQDFEMSVSRYIEKLTRLFPSTSILAVLPIYRNDENNRAREKYRDYTLEDAREILTSIYKKYNNISILKETGIPRIPDVFVSDYLHPNDLGFTFMAKSIGKELLKWH